MDNNNNNNSNNNFFSGFLLGLLVGAAIVFLLGTKKGKRIWKAISEEGIDNISNLLNEANKSSTFEKVLDKSVEPEEVEAEDEPKEKIESFVQREFARPEKTIEEPKVRRFFRGISRRVN